MFEGLVGQLLHGYLGGYIKDIQGDQLKITVWNEEVLLENVELILEAFDYLRLPFALKEGRVGRLSIRIPWKKLGREPIIIILEDVFVCASPRDDQEWSLEAVEQREVASKKAKLAAAELAKLSRRVSDNQAGNSFISYITAKILDSIQVSIRNFHVVYRDMHCGLPSNFAQITLGLKFSSLTIMKQATASTRGLVNKVVEITGLEVYCSSSSGALSLVTMDNVEDPKDPSNTAYDGKVYHHILAPMDVSVSLSVDRSGQLHTDAPQCSVDAEIAELVFSLDEIQLQHILVAWDNLCTYQLREKYGRYRPWSSPLSKKPANWQKVWWRYAQESILSDIRKTFRKTSWRYFGERLSYCRRYVNLYKKKLIFLRQEQSVDEEILLELEQMERDSDVDDILSYRAVAERELQELLVNSLDSNLIIEKSRNLDQSSSRTSGWLNWLSRGMLGAGGTEDSSQFSGVISDEVIKDIYKATEFQPQASSNAAVPSDDRLYRCAVKFHIRQISALLRSTKSNKDTAKLVLNGAVVEHKVWEESSSILAFINSINVISPLAEKTILLSKRDTSHPSCRIRVDLSTSQEVSLKIAVEPLKVSFDAAFFTNCMEFYEVLESVEFQHEKVISSLNGIKDSKARVQSKTEYILSSRREVALDVRVNDVMISMPWTNTTLEHSEMVLGFQALFISSGGEQNDWSDVGKDILTSVPESDATNQLHHMYDHFKVKIDDAEVKLIKSNNCKPVPIMEKFSALIGVASCVVQDISIPKQLEVHVAVPILYVHFSPSIFVEVVELISYLDDTHQKTQHVSLRSLPIDSAISDHVKSSIFGLSLAATLGTMTVHVDLENEEGNSTSCMLSLNAADIRVESTELFNCRVFAQAMKIISYCQSDKLDSRTLCLLGCVSDNTSQHDIGSGIDSKINKNNGKRASADGCFLLHYETCRNRDISLDKCTVSLNDGDIHCYPYIIGLLIGFADRIVECARIHVEKSSGPSLKEKAPIEMPYLDKKAFGFSNILEAESSKSASIPSSYFPFATIRNPSPLSRLKDYLPNCPSDWKKDFSMWNGRSGDVKFSEENESNGHWSLSSKTATSGSEQFVIELSMCRIKLHFHDSSCAIGTVIVPLISSAVFVYEEFVDIFCSSEGMLLNSSCWRPGLVELLWGPASKNFCPILDVRVRVAMTHTYPQVEVNIGIQHVCCILPTEYLALLVGYFSLPDWTSNLKQRLDEYSSSHTDDDSPVMYKIAVLDSDLVIPTGKKSFQFLKLEVPQLYCSIILGSSSVVAEDIPPQYLVDGHKLAERSFALNIFGRQLELSLLLLKGEDGHLILDQDVENRKLTLLAPLSADIWVIVPKESGSFTDSSGSPACIMARIDTCELVADESYLFDGLDGLVTVVDQFSEIEDKSRDFTGNAVQFLQANGCRERDLITLAGVSSPVLVDISLYIASLMIKLHYTTGDSFPSEPVAMAEMKLTCSISMRNEILQFLEINFSSFALYSLPSSAILARCSAAGSDSVLGITLSVLEQVRSDVSFSLPSLEIWMEFSDWVKVLDAMRSLFEEQGRSAYARKSSNGRASSVLNVESVGSESNVLLTSSNGNSPGVVKHESDFLIVRTENMGFTCHFPLPVSSDSFCSSGNASFPLSKDQPLSHCKFSSVTINTKSALLALDIKSSKFKSSIENISASMGISPEKNVRSSPFFQIYQVTLLAEICNRATDLVDISAEIGCDRIEVGLSHQVFYFWRDIELNFPEAEPSQISIGCIDCKLNIRKVSLLLTDGRWTCNGPLIEILIRNVILHAKANEAVVESAIASDLQVNYNNIHKVLWEPFIEPWNFQIRLTRKRETSVLLKSSIVTDIHLKSTAPLNLNITESFFECICRTIEMISDALGLMRSDVLSESSSFLNPQLSETLSDGRYAPYILQNLTSVPLAYCTFLGVINSNNLDTKETKCWHHVQPGSSVPIYIDETAEEQLDRFKPAASSDRLNENQLSGAAHHFIIIQLEGTSNPSMPMSMDLVGLSYFLVDFSKTSSSSEVETAGSNSRLAMGPENEHICRAGDGFVIPVVYDVSVQRFSKLIQLYSTVIVENETSVPLELRFDIPLGLSPKILDPIHPGQKFPLPLHLAESGRVRWRPHGNSCIWSETHILQNILSQDSKIGFFRSFVCYPSHPSCNRFCCCISVRKISLHLWENPKRRYVKNAVEQSPGEHGLLLGSDKLKSRSIYQLTLITPLVVHNYLPEVVSLTIESGGVNHSALLSEVETSFYHIDPSHELGLSFHIQGYKISVSRFPDAEAFSALSKFTGTKYILSDTLTFDADVGKGPINVTLEKRMDAFSGARELFIFVPFLLYNCVGFLLDLADYASEVAAETMCTIPSCYDFAEREPIQMKMDGLALLSSNQDYPLTAEHLSANSSVISIRRFLNVPSAGVDSSTLHLRAMNLSDFNNSSTVDDERGKAGAFAYAPKFSSCTSDNMVKIRRNLPEFVGGEQLGFSWSDPFPLDPASGSITVLVPQQIQNGAYVVSVTSTAISEPFAGHTRAISFQPRYVISNACSKELCYKQKGSDFVFHLGVGQHSHLHWMDTTRDLLVSIRYNEPGWQWSGSFLPDILADTQVKMRNYISGALNMIRVEVQNADVSIRDEKIVANVHGNSGTNLILLSDDDSGYMPYRIENFSKERLRIYQPRCENFETMVNSYQCCPYAWDEPCLPHRLVLEVPGERVLGSYDLDDVKQTMTVQLPATLEKPERTLLISGHAEGATKVLSIVDASCHVFRDLKDSSNNLTHKKRKSEKKRDNSDYNEKVSIVIPYVGVSLINSNSQELLFICLKGMFISLLQSMDQQKLSFRLSSLQIDNQLHATQYPVILSFDHVSRSNSYGLEDGDQDKYEDLQIHSHNSCESVIFLAMSKWRKKDVPFISFEYIMFRMAEFHLELEQEVVSSVAELLRTMYLRLQSGVLPSSDPTEPPVLYDISLLEDPHPLVPNLNGSLPNKNTGNRSLLPSVIPIGAPWQQIYHLARRQKKIYVELFDLASVKFTLSFSSAPWMLRFGIPTSGDSLMHRGLMALADIEGARIHLRELTLSHHMASWESIQEILIRHYTRQLLHEMYKVLGSAGVIGNPIGFARSLGLGIKDFLSVPTRNVLQSPVGLVRDMAQGTTSLLSNTVYALSDAAFQFSKAAQKGIVALTFDDQAVARMERQQRGVASHSQGVINEVLEGLTGLLQSPIRGAEKHGLPGVLSGMALGLTGVVARPAASILEVAGKTAQSIRNRSKHYQTGAAKRLRVRLPRRLRPDLPLKPYSWDEAIGTHVLLEVAASSNNIDDDSSTATISGLGNEGEMLVTCKALRQAGKFVVLSERRILIVSCPSLADFGSPHFPGIPADPEWTIESEIWLDSVIHCDADENVVHVMGSGSSERLLRQRQSQSQSQSHHSSKGKEKWNNFRPANLPLFLMDIELGSREEARQLLLTIEQRTGHRWGSDRVLHRRNIR